MYFSLFELSVVLASQMGKELHFCSTTEDWVSRKMWKGKGEENNWVAQTSSQGTRRTTEDGIVVLPWNLGYCSGLEVGAVCCIWTNYREYVQKNLHWCFHTWNLVHLAVLSLRYIFFLTWYLDLSESVHWRTSLGRACGPQSLSTLKEETVKCMDGLGKWRDCCSSTTSCRDLSRADKCPGSVGYITCRDGQVTRLLLGWCCIVVNLEWLVYLSRPTQVEAGCNLKESDPLPPSVFEWCYCHSSEDVFENLWLSCRACYTSMYCFSIFTILNYILVFPFKTSVNVTWF